MKGARRICAACAVGFFAIPGVCAADSDLATARDLADSSGLAPVQMQLTEKSASASTVASRATSTSSITVYGGFELASSAVIYILVRGNSLGTLGVTQGYLDAPRVRLYNSAGQDLVTDSFGRPGFNACVSTASLNTPVVNYYQNVRGQPVHDRDACLAVQASAGAFTFSVTPSIPGVTTSSGSSSPSSGEILFEVTLGPSS